MQRSWLRPSRLIATLNTAAVGLALSASASAVILRLLGGLHGSADPAAWGVELPTLFFGVVWARGLRSKKSVGTTSVRAGWLASLPLAASNAGVATVLCLHQQDALLGVAGLFLAGVFIGAIIWVPALIVTLICFGLPIAWSQRVAARGLSGEERGDVVVGVAAMLMSVLGLALFVDRLGIALAAGGIASGGAATVLSIVRGRRRAGFVDRVAKGEVPGFRLEETPRGRSLVRTKPGGSAYRVVAFDEEVFTLETPPAARRLQAS